MMPAGAYKKPPITEAVIDIQFVNPMSADDLDALRKVLVGAYPAEERRVAWSIAVGPSVAKVEHAPAGLKMSSIDALDIVVLYPQGITNSRLAPYNGWEIFRDRARSVLSQCTKRIGYRAAKRIGVRYINRLDIPDEPIQVSDWISVGLTLPVDLPSNIDNYRFFVKFPFHGDSKVNLQSSSLASPLIKHGSVMLDIDVYIDDREFAKPEELWNEIEQLRVSKNEIFELCITEKSRNLFDEM